jgi:hypothetical protein
MYLATVRHFRHHLLRCTYDEINPFLSRKIYMFNDHFRQLFSLNNENICSKCSIPKSFRKIDWR